MLSVCTIIARNFLPQARVLSRSFLEHHRDGEFTALLIDDEDRAVDGESEGFACLRLSEIGLSRREIRQLAAIYDVTEFATAVKPRLLSHLLAEGRDHILYLDPDIKVYDSLADAARLARQHGIVLTPHMMSPLPRDGHRIDDAHILLSGVYNLGFIGVGQGTDAFIEWWWGKTRREALIDPGHMMFTDQRWIDYVPSFFRHHLLKDPACNVAYWNLHERDLTWTGGRYLVNGEPLKFFHFSGYSSRTPYLLSKHQGDKPRILLSNRPALRRICGEYKSDLERAGFTDELAPYGWATLGSGLAFDRRMRRLYRTGLEMAERDRAPEPPSPFDCERDFLAWLNEPVAGGLRPQVSRYLHAIYKDRPDLQAAFPDLAGHDRLRYFVWLRGDGVVQEKVPPPLLPPFSLTVSEAAKAAFVSPSALLEGVNIAGYFRAELGIGEAARLLTSALESANVPHAKFDYGVTESRRDHPFETGPDDHAPYDVNIVCVNGDRACEFARDVGPRFFQGRHTIGYWFSELEQLPAVMHPGFDVVDEVWAATRFVADSIGRIGRRPVHVVPLPVPIPCCAPEVTRGRLNLPSGFMFLFMFDFFSILERKNPLGLIRAFRQAFASGEGPTLVLKTINGGKRLNDLERLRASAADRPDILVIDEYYTSEQKNALLGLCDCYVSLHRSEGLGLTMAEAMGLGKPVIATGYSGNLHFMTGENSYLVDYAMSSVPADCYPYPKGSVWADPNLEHAAELMCRVYADRDEASARAARGRQHILTRHNVEISTAALTTRLEAIRRSRRYMRNLVEDAPTPVAVPPVAGPPAETPVATTRRVSRGLSLSFLSRVTRAGRNALTQGLRTYWRRRQRHALLLQNVRDAVTTITKASAVESQQRQALESVWTALHVLESRQQQQQAQIDATRKAVRRDRPVTGVNGPEPEERMAAFEDDRTPFGEAADAIRQTTAEP